MLIFALGVSRRIVSKSFLIESLELGNLFIYFIQQYLKKRNESLNTLNNFH
jgi:hypothetical protein